MSIAIIINGINLFFEILIWTLLVRILLSWVPNMNWYSGFGKTLKDITDPILTPFRNLIPPISGIDLSPIVAFIVLGLVQRVVIMLLLQIAG